MIEDIFIVSVSVWVTANLLQSIVKEWKATAKPRKCQQLEILSEFLLMKHIPLPIVFKYLAVIIYDAKY